MYVHLCFLFPKIRIGQKGSLVRPPDPSTSRGCVSIPWRHASALGLANGVVCFVAARASGPESVPVPAGEHPGRVGPGGRLRRARPREGVQVWRDLPAAAADHRGGDLQQSHSFAGL